MRRQAGVKKSLVVYIRFLRGESSDCNTETGGHRGNMGFDSVWHIINAVEIRTEGETITAIRF